MQLDLSEQDVKDIESYLDYALGNIFARILNEMSDRGTIPIEFTEALDTVGYYTREAIGAVVNEPFDVESYAKAEKHYENAALLLVQMMINSRLLRNALDQGQEQESENDSGKGSTSTDAEADGVGQVRGDASIEQRGEQPREVPVDARRGEVSEGSGQETGLPSLPGS